ncbi:MULTISPECIES: hypothetical protein [unclassified Streptomyces]|nr:MULTISPECIES: hypothetical protein [unclassified Streptomyces]
MVKGRASPDDPALTDYWTQRRRRRKPPLSTTGLWLLQAQRGRCPLCGELLLHADHEPQSPDQWEQWLKVIRKAGRRQAIVTSGPGTSDTLAAPSLVHAHCRRRLGTRPAHFCPSASPLGLA